MRRRGNKSTKVPNVKLRPAQPGDVIRVQDSQFDNDDSLRFHDPTPRPFAGVVLCATGISDKPGLFKQAVELGAVTTNDFTDRVTHLIAAHHGGAKYQCALENKIPILKPDWVLSSYHIWLRGDDVALEQSIRSYRLPVFSSVILCVSGISDVVRREKINKLVTANGGTYVKALERPVRVTHLLCSGDEETDKMYYADKFNTSGEADIKLVWEEWFWDSLEFGGRFNEDAYQARKPRPVPRKSIQRDELEISSTSVSRVVHENVNAHPQAKPIQKPRTVAFTNIASLGQSELSEDEPIQATVRKPVGFQRELWRSVLAPRGYEWNEDASVLMKSPTKAKAQSKSADEEEDAEDRNDGRSVLTSSSFRRANSFSVLPARQPLKRLVSTRFKSTTPLRDEGNGDDDVIEGATPAQMNADTPGVGPSALQPGIDHANAPAPLPPPPPGIFSGLLMTALGEANCENVRAAVKGAGGIWVDLDIVSADETQVDIIIVRLVSGSKLFCISMSDQPTPIPNNLRGRVRTECWLEKCIYDSKLLSPDSHVSFTPVAVPCPISGSNKVRISFSGFDHAEKFFMTRLMKVLGLELSSNFTKRATHLLCPSATGLKFEKAQEWGIPVIGMEWIEEMKKSGTVPDAREYLVAPMQQQLAAKHDARERHNEDPKGKAKAIEVDAGIADITNYIEPQSQSLTQDDSQTTFERERPHGQPLSPSKEARPPITAVPSVPSLSKLNITEGSRTGFGKPTGLLVSSLSGPPANDTIGHDPELEHRDPTSLMSPSKQRELSRRPHSEEETSASTELNAAARFELSDMVPDPRPPPPEEEQVPSSNTPSPIKVVAPTKGKGKGRAFTRSSSARSSKSSSTSPSKVSPSKFYPPAQPIDSETTKALHESLTSLLGKRRSDETEGIDGGKEGRRSREDEDRIDGKRPRRLRSKTFAVTTEKPPIKGSESLHGFGSFGQEIGINDSNPFTLGFSQADELGTSNQDHEQSIRVTYEDPEQRAEKRKLMQLLGSPIQEPEDGKRKSKVALSSTKGKTSKAAAAASSSFGEASTRRRSTRKSGGR